MSLHILFRCIADFFPFTCNVKLAVDESDFRIYGGDNGKKGENLPDGVFSSSENGVDVALYCSYHDQSNDDECRKYGKIEEIFD